MRWRGVGRGGENVNWVEREVVWGESESVCVYRERARERALRQRHVGDVVWLPQAEEGGGVGERWKSVESESVRERETKAGGEEARRKSVAKDRSEEEDRSTCLGQQEGRGEDTGGEQTEDERSGPSFGISPVS